MPRPKLGRHQLGKNSDVVVVPHEHATKGNRAGQHSIRINDQWRVCFVWSGDGADAVEIVDYH